MPSLAFGIYLLLITRSQAQKTALLSQFSTSEYMWVLETEFRLSDLITSFDEWSCFTVPGLVFLNRFLLHSSNFTQIFNSPASQVLRLQACTIKLQTLCFDDEVTMPLNLCSIQFLPRFSPNCVLSVLRHDEGMTSHHFFHGW